MIIRIIKHVVISVKKLIKLPARRDVKFDSKHYAYVGSGSRVEFDKICVERDCKIFVGENSLIVGDCVFDRPGGRIEFGSRTYFAGHIACAGSVKIGDDVLISSQGLITDHQSHALDFEHRSNDVVDYIKGEKDWSHVLVADVTIESKAWIGFNVIILCGITIGEGAVVGAGSVVTRDVPPYTVVAGNPARVIRTLERGGHPDGPSK